MAPHPPSKARPSPGLQKGPETFTLRPLSLLPWLPRVCACPHQAQVALTAGKALDIAGPNDVDAEALAAVSACGVPVHCPDIVLRGSTGPHP